VLPPSLLFQTAHGNGPTVRNLRGTLLAQQWRTLRTRLAADDISNARAFAARRHQLSTERQRAVDRLAGLEGQIEGGSRGLGRLRNRGQLDQLQEAALGLAGQVRVLDNELDQVGRRLAGLPDAEHIEQLQATYTALARRIQHAAAQRIDQFKGDDLPGYLTAALGPRPHHGTTKTWDRAATALEAYRLRWSITDPDRTFASAPTDPLQRTDFRATVQTINNARGTILEERHRPAHHLQRGLAR
jgi:hypothetical protein